jgi:hypothetical protein
MKGVGSAGFLYFEPEQYESTCLAKASQYPKEH